MRSWTNDLLQIRTNSYISAGAALAAAAYPVGQLVAATGTEDISYTAATISSGFLAARAWGHGCYLLTV
jgi:hypothetical protein